MRSSGSSPLSGVVAGSTNGSWVAIRTFAPAGNVVWYRSLTRGVPPKAMLSTSSPCPSGDSMCTRAIGWSLDTPQNTPAGLAATVAVPNRTSPAP